MSIDIQRRTMGMTTCCRCTYVADKIYLYTTDIYHLIRGTQLGVSTSLVNTTKSSSSISSFIVFIFSDFCTEYLDPAKRI